MDEANRRDLKWLGLDWDEGPDVPGALVPSAGNRGGSNYGPYLQSQRLEHYNRHLEQLFRAGLLYPCRLSRRELDDIASAPHGRGPAFPASLRPLVVPEGWWSSRDQAERDFAIRFVVDEGDVVQIQDAVRGYSTEKPAESTGDFVLQRRDGIFAYQFAVVVDDMLMGITEVVRGDDLAASTGRQVALYRALGAPPPSFAHVPLVVDARGDKLSKRNEALTIHHLRDKGLQPSDVIGYMAYSCGFQPDPLPRSAGELIPLFSWEGLRREHWVMGENDPLIRRYNL
jgi:glutamyl-tRNA synthetase